MLDLDDFKGINDRYGHAAGDALLREVVGVLRRRLRASDVAARVGGDEFAVVLDNADTATARRVAAELARDVAATRMPDGPDVRPSASVGVAPLTGDAMAALDAADRAMYRDKHRSRPVMRGGSAAAPVKQVSSPGELEETLNGSRAGNERETTGGGLRVVAQRDQAAQAGHIDEGDLAEVDDDAVESRRVEPVNFPIDEIDGRQVKFAREYHGHVLAACLNAEAKRLLRRRDRLLERLDRLVGRLGRTHAGPSSGWDR
jgi:diguanylate cyclase (GGDEF)-like protein